MSGLTWNGSSSAKGVNFYQFNPAFYWESALPKKAEVQDVLQGEVSWSCLFFMDISTLSPPVGIHKIFLIFKGFEWGSALGLRAPGAVLPAKNRDRSQI